LRLSAESDVSSRLRPQSADEVSVLEFAIVEEDVRVGVGGDRE
jgi:hypothetical protein